MRLAAIAVRIMTAVLPQVLHPEVGREQVMALWLILIIVGVVMLVVGVAVEAAKILIWIGLAILIVSIIMSIISRGKRRV